MKTTKWPKIRITDALRKKYGLQLACVQKGTNKGYYRSADIFLFQKWAYRVGKGWYGFDLGNIPRVWVDILDEFLAWLETRCPDFVIQQIKMKLGMVRIYLGTKTNFDIPDKKIRCEIFKLQNLLSWSPLIRTVRKKRQKNSRKP